MKTITLEASDELADRFAKLSEEDKKGLSEMVRILMEDKRTLRQVMDDISEYAQKQGMTPELLEQLLKKK
jgi:predicted AAA+ superfamily ATPase